MSTQTYRDRLGFDPNEYESGKSQPIYEEKLTKSKGLWQLFVEATSGTQQKAFRMVFFLCLCGFVRNVFVFFAYTLTNCPNSKRIIVYGWQYARRRYKVC